MVDGTDITDGNWHAATLGEFVGLLVDLGSTAATTFRVVEDSEPDANGKFVRTMEVVLWPDGSVGDAILGCHSIHKLLRAFLEAGIIT